MTSWNGNEAPSSGHRRARLSVRRPLAIDLFAGAGGLSLGFEQAGFDIAACVEYDPVHAAVHEFNFPMTEVLCRDVSRLDASELMAAADRGRARHGHHGRWNGDVDLIAGGPPCQGFSLIGKRLIDDPRNRLVFHFVRLVKELRPRYFVMENVPGMRVGGHSSILERLIVEFEDEGFIVVRPVETLNAMDFGVPQERVRVFLLGAREGEPLPEYPSPWKTPTPTVWDAIGDMPNLDRFDELWKSDEVELPRHVFAKAERCASGYARVLRGAVRDVGDLSHPRAWPRHVLTSSTRTRHTALSISRFAATTPGEVEPVSRFLRLHPEGVCNTLRAGTGSERGAYTSPRPIHPTLPRVLSVREAARLHGFPDWFRFHRTKWHGFRQIGNAVVPPVARAVGYSIVAALRVRPPVPTTQVRLGSADLLGMSMTEAADYFGADKSAMPPSRQRTAVARS